MLVKLIQPGERTRAAMPRRKMLTSNAEVPLNSLYLLGKFAQYCDARIYFYAMFADGTVSYLKLSEQSPDVQKVLKPLFKKIPQPIAPRGGFSIVWGEQIQHAESD